MATVLSGRWQSICDYRWCHVGPQPLTTGLPQGSQIGPFAFPAYSSPLFRIARKHGVEMHMYADETHLYLKFKPHKYNWAILKMEERLSEIRL